MVIQYLELRHECQRSNRRHSRRCSLACASFSAQLAKRLNDEPANGVYEYQFHSDAHITGEFTSGLGPYSFLNTVPIPDTPGIVTAPIILRLVDHLPEYRPDMSKKDETFYHGGRWLMNLRHYHHCASVLELWRAANRGDLNPARIQWDGPAHGITNQRHSFVYDLGAMFFLPSLAPIHSIILTC